MKSTRAMTPSDPVRPQIDRRQALPRGSRFLRYLLVGLDAAALLVAAVIAIVVVPGGPSSVVAMVLSAAALIAGGLVVFGAVGLYRARVCTLRTVEYEHLARGCVVVGFLALGVTTISSSVSPTEILVAASVAFVLTIVVRSGYRTWLTNQRRVGRYLRSILLVGAGNECAGIAALLDEHPELGYRAVGIVGDELDALKHGLHDLWCGELEDGLAVLTSTHGTGAIICVGDLHSFQLNQIVQELLRAGVRIQMSSGLQGVDVGRLRPSPLAHEPFFYVEHITLASWQLATKRDIDIALSGSMLILTLPLLAVAALGIKLQDLGPVLFRQSRVGRQGAPFMLYKLRTMREGAESETRELLGQNLRDGPLTKFARDPRVTKLGRILRATSIDELPQLWNVLNGTMSLVGPRPALPNEVAHFDAELRAREAVRPGITGLWQVEGRDNPSFAAYRRFDLFYLQNWSVALDLMIVLTTVESIIARLFRVLLHPQEDIRLAPPQAVAPAVGRTAPLRVVTPLSAPRAEGSESVKHMAATLFNE